ncbi:MAG: hypothetical protein EPN21_00080 [Methylococcaceae bacterium]|nr:MAG: hypothetical protein EPN21_00080 [Methylococcaceae bacterium]
MEADTAQNPKAVYDLMDELKLPAFHITQAEIKVTFAPVPGSSSRSRTFKISYPNWCALRHEGRDLIVRQMLTDSGIDPMKPEAETQDSGS